MEKRTLRINYALLVLLILFTVGHLILNILPLKWLASTCFVVLAFVNFFYTKKAKPEKTKAALCMLTGMILAMGGDVSINFNFVAGAAAFALGHVFYFITYCVIERFRKSDFILSFILIAICTCFLFAAPIFEFKGLEAVALAYCIIINFMTGKAVMNACRNRTKSNLVFAVGSVLFLISDIMLVLNSFADTSNITHILCLSIYYPGQWVLSFGMFHLGNEPKESIKGVRNAF